MRKSKSVKIPPYTGNKPIRPLEYKELTEAQIRLAYKVWDNLMPECKGILNPDRPTRWQIDIVKKSGLSVQFVAEQTSRLVGVTTVYEHGAIDFFTFRNQVRDDFRQTYINLYTLGVGGSNNMTQADWVNVGEMLKEQYIKLNQLMDRIARGELSSAQVFAELNELIGFSSEAFWKAYIHDMAINLPAYPGDGSTKCLTNCQCYWEIQQVPGGYDCYWKLGKSERCPDCVQRVTEWNPYRIRIASDRVSAG